jgi:sulfopyruvate decarboxylase TPP-binding subunit
MSLTTEPGSTRSVERAESLDPVAMFAHIVAAGVTHVVTVPDTHQKTLLDVLTSAASPALITMCTEDEALGVNLGLYVGGQRPLLLIQNSGFYAAMNTVRGLALDAKVPACLLIGEFSRNPEIAPADHASRLVNLLEPTLATWGVPSHRLDHHAHLPLIQHAMEQAWRTRGPVALLLGAPTGSLA